jgi:hypothetical protein
MRDNNVLFPEKARTILFRPPSELHAHASGCTRERSKDTDIGMKYEHINEWTHGHRPPLGPTVRWLLMK